MKKNSSGNISVINDDDDKIEPLLERVAMSDEDALFYILKHGHPPSFRLEKTIITINGIPEVRFILTNIPEPGDIDYD